MFGVGLALAASNGSQTETAIWPRFCSHLSGTLAGTQPLLVSRPAGLVAYRDRATAGE